MPCSIRWSTCCAVGHGLPYAALRLQFGLTEEQPAVLKAVLIDAQQLARDEDGRIMVWTGAGPVVAPTPYQRAATKRRWYTVLLAAIGLLQREQRVIYRALLQALA